MGLCTRSPCAHRQPSFRAFVCLASSWSWPPPPAGSRPLPTGTAAFTTTPHKQTTEHLKASRLCTDTIYRFLNSRDQGFLLVRTMQGFNRFTGFLVLCWIFFSATLHFRYTTWRWGRYFETCSGNTCHAYVCNRWQGTVLRQLIYSHYSSTMLKWRQPRIAITVSTGAGILPVSYTHS